MKRIYGDFAYGNGPRAGCWWDETCTIPDQPALTRDLTCDVAVIGAGFTGLSTALHLAQAGLSVVVLEAERVGWGASGRNGGFCCLGGGILEDDDLDRRFGKPARLQWRAAEVAAVRYVEDLITTHSIDVDRHSQGETQLAHRPRDAQDMQAAIPRMAENYGVTPQFTPAAGLAEAGMSAEFHGALTVPVGFALNPRKYIAGLLQLALDAGVQVFDRSAVTGMARAGSSHTLRTSQAQVQADRVVVATNGYSSEDLPTSLAGRYMPTQSSIIVTRPMSQSELGAQGWTSAQAAYDTKHLLHYFRLMPDNRMLFGVRGGLMASAGSERRAMRRARADFDRMFPAWRGVETPFNWSGMVCIARNQMPFVGALPDEEGVFAALCYHGNGVAMASYSGAILADLILDRASPHIHAEVVKQPLRPFELGRFRRALMPLAYAKFGLQDL